MVEFPAEAVTVSLFACLFLLFFGGLLVRGRGGHAAGDVASRQAIRALRLGDITNMAETFKVAHEGILRKWDEMEANGECSRYDNPMGTTLSALTIRGDRVTVAHVGDSRVYWIRSGQVEQLTKDHANGHVLLNCLGNSPTAYTGTDVYERSARPGDAFVLCTDGLSDHLDDPDELVRLRRGLSAKDFAKALVTYALGGGGHDNITVVVVCA